MGLGDRYFGGWDVQPVMSFKPLQTSIHKVTHDFCLKQTWWQNSTQVLGEALGTTTPTLVYYTANPYVIDVENGITTRQDLLQSYLPVIYNNGTPISSSLYSINYVTGVITFNTPQVGTITADYYYAGSSTWTLAPDEGKVILIEYSEVQFAADAQVDSPLKFEIWVTNPADPPNKMLYQYVQYNSMRDLINEANLGTGKIQAIDLLTQDTLVFPFNYGSVKPLKYSDGAELRVMVNNDVELTGSYGTATFYCLIMDDV